jgi:3-phenylpropionate/trans-cinnamate dioxygenase ferredoxin subunit
MNKYLVGKTVDYKNGMKKRVMAGTLPLMLAFVDGQFFAIEDTCTHAKASLSAGQMEGFQIQCAWHGATFDIRTGQVLVLPAAIPVKTFKVWTEDENIWAEV